MPDKYKKDISIEVLVGLFMFTILIALGVFTIVLSRQNFLQKKYPLEVLFSEVGGLREGDQVFLRGTQVGVIKSTQLTEEHVLVSTDLEVPVHFREGYKVEVVASSMLGGKMMKIYEGPLAAPSLAPNTQIMGEKPIDILDELSVAVNGIKGLTDRAAAGEGTLGKLLADDTLYDQLTGIMENLHHVSEKLAEGQGTVGKLIQDDTLYDSLQITATNLAAISSRLAKGESTLGKLLSEDDTLYNDLQNSMANIRNVTEKISGGEGTLGRLVEDDQIYLEAQKLLEELRAAIDDMRETSPVTTFSTVFFGGF